jgi:hypothetical protein
MTDKHPGASGGSTRLVWVLPLIAGALIAGVAAPRKERAYEKYAWVLAFLWGLFTVVIGLYDLFSGYTGYAALPSSTPSAAINLVNSGYQSYYFVLIYLGVSFMLVSATGFRLGQKWSWYFIFAWFVFYVIDALLYFSNVIDTPGVPIPLPQLLFGLGLLLPYRKFFSRQLPNGVPSGG